MDLEDLEADYHLRLFVTIAEPMVKSIHGVIERLNADNR